MSDIYITYIIKYYFYYLFKYKKRGSCTMKMCTMKYAQTHTQTFWENCLRGHTKMEKYSCGLWMHFAFMNSCT